MSDNNVRLSLKIRDLQIEFEGTENFMINDLSNTLDNLMKFVETHKSTIGSHQREEVEESSKRTSQLSRADLSVSTIASRTGASKAGDLAIAAAAHLIIVQGMEKFSRKELLKAMRSDNSRFKTGMSSNLTDTLTRLVSGKSFNHLSSGSYSLTPNERERLENILDQEV